MVSFDNGTRRLGGSALATREQVAAYIQAMKTACKKRCILRDRPKNIQGLADLGWKQSQVRDAVADLQVEDYSRGPLPDKRGLGEEMWVFAPCVDGQHLYVKVAILGWGLKVHSFHRVERPLSLPLR